MQSDLAKSDGIILIWESDGPSRQILAQNPTIRPIGLSNRKMESLFNQQVKIYLTEQSRPGQQQYEVRRRRKVWVAIVALDYKYNHDGWT